MHGPDGATVAKWVRLSPMGMPAAVSLPKSNVQQGPLNSAERQELVELRRKLRQVQTLTVQHAGASEAVAYFGCWLDFNQTEPQFPVAYPNSDGPYTTGRLSILQLVRGLHQCLVAEVRFQPGATDPISTGATPGSSDRLAQRNLAIVESDNPGEASTHVVQHTLLIKPSEPVLNLTKAAASTDVSAMPDELVLRFGTLPEDTVASLYFPDFSADDILALERTARPHTSWPPPPREEQPCQPARPLPTSPPWRG